MRKIENPNVRMALVLTMAAFVGGALFCVGCSIAGSGRNDVNTETQVTENGAGGSGAEAQTVESTVTQAQIEEKIIVKWMVE